MLVSKSENFQASPVLRYTDQEMEAQSTGRTGLVNGVVAQPNGRPRRPTPAPHARLARSVGRHKHSSEKTCKPLGSPPADLTGIQHLDSRVTVVPVAGIHRAFEL